MAGTKHSEKCKHPPCCKHETSVAIITQAPGLCFEHHLRLSQELRKWMREFMDELGYPQPAQGESAYLTGDEAREVLQGLDLSIPKGRVH